MPTNRRQTRIKVVPKNAPQLLTQLQSTEQTKIVILAFYSRVAYMRNFFPEIAEDYVVRYFDLSDCNTTYESFLDGTASNGSVQDNTAAWKILPHGCHSGADKFYEWMHGLNDALDRQYLRSVHLTVHGPNPEPVSSEDIIESYTISINYDNALQVEVESSLGTGVKSVALATAKKDFYNLFQDVQQKLVIENSRVGSLRGFRLMINLVYNENCSPAYEAPKFRSGSSDTRRTIREAAGIGRSTLEGQFHQIVVGWNGGRQGVTAAGSMPPPVAIAAGSPLAPRDLAEVTSQTSSQVTALAQFRSMALLRDARHVLKDTQPLVESLPAIPLCKPFEYNSYVMNSIDKHKQADAEALDEAQDKCDCLSDMKDDIVTCDTCTTWQHLVCYGYTEGRPALHVCYNCLDRIAPFTVSERDSLRDRVLLRKIIFQLLHVGDGCQSSLNDLAKDTDMPVASLRTLLAEYAKEHGLKAEFNKVSKNKRADRFSFSLDDMDLPAVFDPSWGIQNFINHRGSLSRNHANSIAQSTQMDNSITRSAQPQLTTPTRNTAQVRNFTINRQNLTEPSPDASTTASNTSTPQSTSLAAALQSGKRKAIDETPEHDRGILKRTAYRSPLVL